jgi:hypothetical protein
VKPGLDHFAFMEDKDVLRAIKNTPAGRWSPKDIAEVTAFSLQPCGGNDPGQIIAVDGGYTLPVPG